MCNYFSSWGLHHYWSKLCAFHLCNSFSWLHPLTLIPLLKLLGTFITISAWRKLLCFFGTIRIIWQGVGKYYSLFIGPLINACKCLLTIDAGKIKLLHTNRKVWFNIYQCILILPLGILTLIAHLTVRCVVFWYFSCNMQTVIKNVENREWWH